MSKSGLTTATALADSSNYTHGRKGYKICKITPHHMAGVLTGKQCARIFQNPSRNASANIVLEMMEILFVVWKKKIELGHHQVVLMIVKL